MAAHYPGRLAHYVNILLTYLHMIASVYCSILIDSRHVHLCNTEVHREVLVKNLDHQHRPQLQSHPRVQNRHDSEQH